MNKVTFRQNDSGQWQAVVRADFECQGRREEVVLTTPYRATQHEAHEALVEGYRSISPWFWSDDRDDFGNYDEEEAT